jgi:hypothetical protein
MALAYDYESYTAIVGHNRENADMCNPSGATYGEIYYATATTEDGKIFSYCSSHRTKDDAIADAIFCEEHQIPTTSKDFDFVRHSYGSESYQANYAEAEGALRDTEDSYYY